MNANELADLLEVDSWYKLVSREEIATMLRQQQSEIKALKEALSMKVILNEHAQQSMKEIKELLK
jgi:guanylate kinase